MCKFSEQMKIVRKSKSGKQLKVISVLLYRGGGAGCAGCAFAHPIFGPLVNKM